MGPGATPPSIYRCCPDREAIRALGRSRAARSRQPESAIRRRSRSDLSPGDIVAVVRGFLAGMPRRHPIAVAIKQHPGEEARLARSSAASVPGGIAGELLLNGIPERLIDDRRVFARMELALVNDLTAIGAVLQHQVERAPRERLP